MLTAGRVRVFVLWLADVLCVGTLWTSVVLGYWLLGQFLRMEGLETSVGGYDPAIYLQFWPVPLVFTFFNAVCDLYHGNWMYPSAPLSPVEELRRLVGTSFLTHIGVIAALGLAYQTTDGYSRVVVVVSGLLTAVGAQSFRNWARIILKRFNLGQIQAALAGDDVTAQRLAAILADDAYAGIRIVGYFTGIRQLEKSDRDQGGVLESLGVPYLGSLHDIVPKSRQQGVRMLLACQEERLFRAQMDEFSEWFSYIDRLPTARTFPIFGARGIVFDGLGGLEMVNQGRMKVKRLQKRFLDTLLAVFAMVLLTPLFIVLPILIKLTSRGPVFYRQRRLGQFGVPFEVLKFRSMYADADARLEKLRQSDPAIDCEWQLSFKLKNDPRVTPLGRFLRKASLDELPQLFNVLKGDMALIGPRPIVEDEVSRYGEAYRIFSSVKPGVTGLWQVSGRSDTDYTRRVALDTYYVLNWSPWMDIWILIRTCYAVLFMRGAV